MCVCVCVWLAAPNQFATPAVSGQPAASTSAMQFVPQMMNYPGVPQQFVPAANYGFYAQPVMHGAAVPAGFTVGSTPKQFSAVNGTASGGAGGVTAGTQQTMAQPAAGSWPSQTHQVVNPFLVGSHRF